MFKGPALRPTLPDVGAVVRSVVGVLLMSAVALYWLGPGAAIATAGAAAIAGAVALQDSPRGSFRLVASVSMGMGVAVLLAGAATWHGLVFAAVVAAWGFLAGMTWAVSANAGLVAAAAMALLIITPFSQPVWPTAAWSAGLAVAAGLTQAALIAIWPKRRWRGQRAALTRAYRSLADDARALAENGGGHVDVEPLDVLRETFTVTAVQGARRPHSYRSWYGLPERIAVTLNAIASKPGSDGERILLAASGVLAAIAVPSDRERVAAGQALTDFDVTAADVDGPESTLAQRLSTQLRDAVGLRYGELVPNGTRASEATGNDTVASEATGNDTVASEATGNDTVASEATGNDQVVELRRAKLPVEIRVLVPAVRRHLDWNDPVLRHAVRLSGSALLGALIARFADLGHGYWIPLTVVMVLRPETAHTYTRCVGRIAGNAIGIVVASAFVVVLHPTGLFAAAFAVAFLAVAYLASSIGYVAVSAALAAAIVFLVDVADPAGPAMLGDRLLATLIGGALAVLAHVALPDHAAVRLRQRAGELLKTEMDYAATVIKAFVHELDHPAEALSAAWERAYRARAAFEAAAGAGPPEDRESRRWLRAYRTGLNAVTASCAALESSLPAHPPTGWGKDFVAAIDEYAEALCGDPATPGSAWHADVGQLVIATERVRGALPSTGAKTARVLVAEIGVITGQLVTIGADISPGPTAG